MPETTPAPAPLATDTPSATDTPRMFSPRQRRVLGFSITLFAACVAVSLLVSILVVIGQLMGKFSNVLWPLAIAGVLALILRPAVDALERLFRGRRMAAVIVLYVLFVALVTVLAIIAIPPLANQLVELVTYLPKLWANASRYMQEHSPDLAQRWESLSENPLIAGLTDEISKLPALIFPSLKALGGGVFSLVNFTVHFVVFPVYLFFFLLSRAEPTAKLGGQLTFLKPDMRDDIVFLVNEFVAIIVSFFRGQMLIGLIMGVLFAIGFWIFGLQFGVLLGLVIGFLNIIPYVGTISGVLITVPIAFFQPGGGPLLVLEIMIVYVAVQCIEGWFLTPKIMGDRTGLHPAVIIFAIFFWGTAIGGIMGMLLAIPLTAFFVTFWRLLHRKYFTP